MTRDETHERGRTSVDESIPLPEHPELPGPVLAAYDAVKGTDAFIVAAVDSDDAWIAIEAGGERALGEWR